jgi:hypothetical protein
MNRFILSLVACLTIMALGESAQAQTFGQPYGGYGPSYNSGRGHSFGPGLAPHYSGSGNGFGSYGAPPSFNRPHVDYTPGHFDSSRRFPSYTPGHYDLHQGGARYQVYPNGAVSPWKHWRD